MTRNRLALVALLALAPASLMAQGTVLSARMGERDIGLGMSRIPARVGVGDTALLRRMSWRTAQPGLQVATVDLRAGSLAIPIQAVVVRAEPARFRFALEHRVQANGMTGTWTTDSAGAGVAIAMNAGQFKETGPWGWLVIDGEERRNPGRAPLGIGIRIDTAGRIAWVPPGREPSFRHDAATAFAFQSFPLLYYDRRVPLVLRSGAATSLSHRDTRLIMAESDDGALLFVITRYAALGALAERVPIGLTTPESLALAAALGARHAVMLDGGGSAQLAIRDGAGAETHWRGFRTVPLALVAVPRTEH